MLRTALTGAAVFAAAGAASAVQVDVTGGQTSVLLDTATLETAASLTLSGVSTDVIAPGNLGPDSVAFAINPRDAMTNPTTFSFDSDDFLGTFSGTIEHSGSVFFNDDAVEVGDFSIGFDGARASARGDGPSGFFVQSTTGIEAILFDIGMPSTLEATPNSATIGANLLVSPEFASFLLDQGLASSDLTGADVGDALVEAVPAPGAVALGALAGLAATRRRR